MSRIQRDYSKRTWLCVTADSLQLTKAEGKMLADNLAAYVEIQLLQGSPSSNPDKALIPDPPLDWTRGTVDDWRVLVRAAVDAITAGLTDGEAQGKQPGEWRSTPLRDHLHYMDNHSCRYRFGSPNMEHLTHAVTRAVMAYALREGK